MIGSETRIVYPDCEQTAKEHQPNEVARPGAVRNEELRVPAETSKIGYAIATLQRVVKGSACIQVAPVCSRGTRFRLGMVKRAGAGLQRLLRHGTEGPCERRFERPSGILDVLARAIPQQLVDHRISAVDEFDDQVCPESGKPLDQIGDRNVPADDHVVDEREAQDEFG